MIRPSLTAAERRAFVLIRDELVAGRLAPSYQELLERLGLTSKGGLHRIVQSLIRKGYVVSRPGSARSLALVPGADSYTIHLSPDVDARLNAHMAAWAATPEAVIVKALGEYLARQP